MNTEKLSAAKLRDIALVYLQTAERYSLLLFVALVVILYGFLLFRINSLNSAQPSSAAIESKVEAGKTLRIDQKVVHQLQSLQDNSVSVKTLFNQARSNPFQ
jgi:hypothetical protein